MSEYKLCSNGHYYQGDHCPYCKEKEKLKSQLEDLRKNPPSFPPIENAMCYCQAPPGWDEHDDNSKGKGWLYKVLIILAIIVAVAIVIAIVYALV